MAEDLISLLKDKFHISSIEEQTRCIIVEARELKKLCLFLKENLSFDYLMNLAAIDYKDKFALVYVFYSFASKNRVCLKVFLERSNPSVESIAALYHAADWHEREAYDVMGINFVGHHHLRRILLPDDWQGHPLRKDYEKEGVVRMPQG